MAVEISGGQIDWDLLKGSWRMLYTTAPDVIQILQAEQLGRLGLVPLKVGEIYQCFSAPVEGRAANVILASVPGLLEESGVTLTVGIRYTVETPKRLGFIFEQARVQNVRISKELESFLAPAILRGWPNQ